LHLYESGSDGFLEFLRLTPKLFFNRLVGANDCPERKFGWNVALMVPGVTRTGSWVVGCVSQYEEMPCEWGNVIIDDDLFVCVVVEGVSCVANLVILVTVHVVFEPGCFSNVCWSPDPSVSLLSSCLRIVPHLSIWSVNRPDRFWLSAAAAVR